MSVQETKSFCESFWLDPAYKAGLEEFGLDSIDKVFSLETGEALTKDNLAGHRKRIRLQLKSPPGAIYLKLYDSPPIWEQLKTWLTRRRRTSFGCAEAAVGGELASLGIKTARIIGYGQQWGRIFEKRSFILTEAIPDGEALERKLPGCFAGPPTPGNLGLRRDFIEQLARFIRQFHDTGLRHRDLYLSHVFFTDGGDFYLIDLARAFRPLLSGRRYQIKDIAQLYYSAPARRFSNSDRLRFYAAYAGHRKLNAGDKSFIRKVVAKAGRMAGHDIRHGRPVGFRT